MSKDLIGGKEIDDLTPDELRAALRERLRVNVGLAIENKHLRERPATPKLTMPDGKRYELVLDEDHVRGDLYLSAFGDLRESVGEGMSLASYWREVER